MTDKDPFAEDEQSDDDVAPEVNTTFATMGAGWSGRDDDDLDVVDLEK